ncbi:MAG: Tripartite tricarboxylate transporter family receptor [Syntrophorhabdaceae bacterium PtaU1.Bin034]|nr:MAG: Tripartite tricarboxylate transporter family receptor [Syntrophorhabdaceae bacterium PtaU1.Bin034]
MKSQKLQAFFVCISLLFAASLVFAADDYPNKPIQLICPYAVGGVTDLSSRLIAEKMGEYLKQPVIVVNKPGAGAALGTGFVAGSKPDGYTIVTTWTGISVLVPLINPNLPFKMSDLAPIGKSVVLDMLMLVNKDVPAKTIPEFIAYAKKNPKKLSYATAGVGTLPHLVMEQFNMLAGTDLQHIPNNSELQAVTAVVGKHVHATVVGLTVSQSHIKTGSIRAIATLTEKRAPDLPNVATAAEQGYPALTASIYNLLFAPGKTPPHIVKKLEAALEYAMKDKDTQQKLNKMDYRVDFLNGKDAKDFLNKETQKWSSVVKKANIQIK